MEKNAANAASRKKQPTPSSWKPGQSGNPHGRPSQGISWKELIVKVANEESDVPDILWKERVVRAAFVHASEGNAAILRELFARSGDENENNELHDLLKKFFE